MDRTQAVPLPTSWFRAQGSINSHADAAAQVALRSLQHTGHVAAASFTGKSPLSHATLSPRAQSLLNRIETWSSSGPMRAVAVKVLVTVGGPLVVLAGAAMLVLPGPGLVVIALGLALLAVEYQWARGLLALLGRGLGQAKRAALPSDGSPVRRLAGIAGTAGFLVVTTLATGAITTFLGSRAFL